MSESIRFVDLIQSRIDGFFDARASILVSIADELATSKNDPWAVALWRAHVERALLEEDVLHALQ